MINDKQLKVCFVGVGSIAEKFHLPIICNNKKSILTSIVDLNIKQAEKISQTYKVPFFKNISEIPEAEICFVATPSHIREQIIIPAIDKGMHIVCEKPFAFDYNTAEGMVDYANKKGKKIFVAQTRRFFPNIELIQSILRSDILKKPLTITITEGGAFGWDAVASDRANTNNKDFGVVHDEGAHIFDMASQFLTDLNISIENVIIINSFFDKRVSPNSCKSSLMFESAAGNVYLNIKFSRSLAIDSKISIEAPGVFIKTRSLFANSATVIFSNSETPMTMFSEENSTFVTLEDAFYRQWDSVLLSLSNKNIKKPPTIEAKTVLSSIKLIDRVIKQAITEPIDEYFFELKDKWK